MDTDMLHALWTVMLVAVFVGIVIWAWSGKRRRRFEAAARLPLEDDAAQGEGKHG